MPCLPRLCTTPTISMKAGLLLLHHGFLRPIFSCGPALPIILAQRLKIPRCNYIFLRELVKLPNCSPVGLVGNDLKEPMELRVFAGTVHD
jgi:hypothetical protein